MLKLYQGMHVKNAVGAFSPAPFDELASAHAALLSDPHGTNAQIDLLWLGCGRQEPDLFASSQALAELFANHQIRHTWHPTDGVHNYALWREHLIDFLPRLFRPPGMK